LQAIDSKVIYLHGFASGPSSRKAQAFRKGLLATGVEVTIPELDGGDFEHLTITGQLEILRVTAGDEPVRLIGSSMGGYLAALFAARRAQSSSVEQLVLLAPAFGFAERWRPHWLKEAGERPLEVYHYASGTRRQVGFELLEDAERYPAFPDFSQPALIFHGEKDEVVPVDYSRRYAAGHPNVRLRELDSDHELLDQLDVIVAEALTFLARE
jgi:hypothetical protein